MIDELLIDSIKVERLSDSLLSAATFPLNSSISQTYPQEVVFDVAVAGGTATLVFTGVKNDAGIQETLVFDGVLSPKTTSNYFDGLSTVVSTAATGSSVTIDIRTRMGQPYLALTTILASQPARFSSVRRSRLFTERGIATDLDKKVLFAKAGKGVIKFKDIITDLETNEIFTVLDVNDIKDRVAYHHTEMLLGREG